MFKISAKDKVTCLKMSRTLFGKPLRVASAFIVDGLAIESGPAYFKRQMHIHYHNNPPEQAIFTHPHEDHAGNIDLLNQLGIIPFVHEVGIPYLASPPVIPYYRRFVWGKPGAGQSQAAGTSVETDKHIFRVLHAPGHSPDHLCLYEEKEGWLFTGDLFVGEKIIYLYKAEDLTAMKKTLKVLSELDFSTLFCSHRGPLKKGPEALARKLRHIETMQEKATDLQEEGFSVPQITRKLLGKEDYMYVISGGEFSKTAFVKALISRS